MLYHEERLLQVHPVLSRFVMTLISELDHHWDKWIILCGWRNQADQHAAFLAGTSKLDWPNGPHNRMIEVDDCGILKMIPSSRAVDLAPYPYDAGKDKERLYLIAGYALCLAHEEDVELIIGADWDGDLQTLDQQLADPWHFELVLP